MTHDPLWADLVTERVLAVIDLTEGTHAVKARRFGLTQSGVDQWRRGTSRPDLYSVYKVARTSGSDANWLMGLK